jgi:hypothetical protein
VAPVRVKSSGDQAREESIPIRAGTRLKLLLLVTLYTTHLRGPLCAQQLSCRGGRD